MKNPKALCTIEIATSMLTAIPNAAIRARNPRMSPRPPKNSAAIARNANGAGMCIAPVKKAMVPEKPYPPNQPSIFCAPCAKNTTPSTSRRTAVAISSSVANSLRTILQSPSRDLPLWDVIAWNKDSFDQDFLLSDGHVEQRRPILDGLKAEPNKDQADSEDSHPSFGNVIGHPFNGRRHRTYDGGNYSDCQARLQSDCNRVLRPVPGEAADVTRSHVAECAIRRC